MIMAILVVLVPVVVIEDNLSEAIRITGIVLAVVICCALVAYIITWWIFH